MISLWIRGLILRRPTRLAAAAFGIAIAVALLASSVRSWPTPKPP